MVGWIAYTALLAVMSMVTLWLFALDKRRAARGGRRIAERTLHLCELLGGWPGAIFGQRMLRHKSRKATYRLVLLAIAVLHLSGAAWAAWQNMG